VIGWEKEKKRFLLLADQFLGIIAQLLFVETLITFSVKKNKTILKPSYYSSYPPAYEDGTECSETSVYKI
jgi:hypothetical protein